MFTVKLYINMYEFIYLYTKLYKYIKLIQNYINI